MPPRSLRPWVNLAFDGRLRLTLEEWRDEGLSWVDIAPLVNDDLAEGFRAIGEEPEVVYWTTIMNWAHDEYGIE